MTKRNQANTNTNINTNARAAYRHLKASAWPTKHVGAMPSDAEFTVAATMVKRAGTGKHFGVAMALREMGVTGPELSIATGDTQLNGISDAVKVFKLAKYVEAGKRNNVKVYRLVPTGKAKAMLKALQADEQATDQATDQPTDQPTE